MFFSNYNLLLPPLGVVLQADVFQYSRASSVGPFVSNTTRVRIPASNPATIRRAYNGPGPVRITIPRILCHLLALK